MPENTDNIVRTREFASITPMIVRIVLAIEFLLCTFGGSKQISKATGVLVPVMGVFYILVSLVVIVTLFNLVPKMFMDIFQGAFDFKAIFGGFTGSAPIGNFYIILAKPAIQCMNDYIAQRKSGKTPVFKAASINLADKTDFWN